MQRNRGQEQELCCDTMDGVREVDARSRMDVRLCGFHHSFLSSRASVLLTKLMGGAWVGGRL